MLFMVIERFKNGNPEAVGERFRCCGRMVPEGAGLCYIDSWMAADGACCYQIMEAPDKGALERWIANWQDLVEFDVSPVVRSAEFWAARAPRPGSARGGSSLCTNGSE